MHGTWKIKPSGWVASTFSNTKRRRSWNPSRSISSQAPLESRWANKPARPRSAICCKILLQWRLELMPFRSIRLLSATLWVVCDQMQPLRKCHSAEMKVVANANCGDVDWCTHWDVFGCFLVAFWVFQPDVLFGVHNNNWPDVLRVSTKRLLEERRGAAGCLRFSCCEKQVTVSQDFHWKLNCCENVGNCLKIWKSKTTRRNTLWVKH